MELRTGDRVEILTGRRKGEGGKVTSVSKDRVDVHIEGLDYDRSYLKTEVKLVTKASKLNTLIEDGTVGCTPLQVTGDKKQRLTAYLVKTGQLCPSWPYSCDGTCLNVQREHTSKIQNESEVGGSRRKVQTVGEG